LAASAAGLNHLISFPKKVQVHFGQDRDNCYFNTMPSYIPEMNLFGVKVVSRIPNRSPALQGDILLYNSISGDLLAFMDGTWITAWRTAAIAAITVEKLKKEDAKSISIMGLGNIARAFVLCINSIYKHSELNFKILAYKDQHNQFIERFKNFNNIHFEVYSDAKELIRNSEVIVSCVTAKDDLWADEKDFKPGILVVPVMTRGFQNCDLAFDKIFCDDIPHISGFKYFKQYKNVTEMTDVLNNFTFVRGGQNGSLHTTSVSPFKTFFMPQKYLLSYKKKMIIS
jgi:ornithine cyclodeaminase/alanine dehydrogenase-like protein (mu-crystallin family)